MSSIVVLYAYMYNIVVINLVYGIIIIINLVYGISVCFALGIVVSSPCHWISWSAQK